MLFKDENLSVNTERILAASAAVIPLPVLIVTDHGSGPEIVWTNPAAETIIGSGVVGEKAETLFPGVSGFLSAVPVTFPVVVPGTSSSYEVSVVPVVDNGKLSWVLTTRCRSRDDLTDLLNQERAMFRVVSEAAPIGILISEAGLRVRYANPSAAQIFGVRPEELTGLGWMQFIAEEDREPLTEMLMGVLNGEPSGELTVTFQDTNHFTRIVMVRVARTETSGSAGFVALLEDVTCRYQMESRLSWAANHDHLTGLANRSCFLEEAARLLASAREQDRSFAVLFLDLDGFKPVNDMYGHDVGDRLIVTVAERLTEVVRDEDLVARFAGDEFVVLLHGINNDHQAKIAAERIRLKVSEPVEINGNQVQVSCSVGFTVANPGETVEDLLVRADHAMYQQKRAGKIRKNTTPEEILLVEDLQEVLTSGSINMVYQPIHDLESGAPVGMEALARWTHPELGPIPPSVFIPLIERFGFSNEFTTYVLSRVATDMSSWGEDSPGWVAVNVPARELVRTFPEQVRSVFTGKGIDLSRVCIEITETGENDDHTETLETIKSLRAMGCQISIDDFGAGQSTIQRLLNYPVDHVKVDRTVTVQPMNMDGESPFRAVNEMVSKFGVFTIAEGVETEEHLRTVISAYCRFAQGWLWVRELTADQVPGYYQTPVKGAL